MFFPHVKLQDLSMGATYILSLASLHQSVGAVAIVLVNLASLGPVTGQGCSKAFQHHGQNSKLPLNS